MSHFYSHCYISFNISTKEQLFNLNCFILCHEFLLDVRIQETDCDIVICEKPLCAMFRKWLKQNTSNYSDFFVFKVEKKALNGQFEGVCISVQFWAPYG